MEKKPKKYILINRVFSGEYVKSGKIGHEMINFIADDRGNQWCYANKNGLLGMGRYGKVEWVINTILIRRGVFEVLNAFDVAGGELGVSEVTHTGKRINFIEDHSRYINQLDIRFGGVGFHHIFKDMSVITFKTSKVYLPKKRIVLTDEPLGNDPLSADAVELDMKGSKRERKHLATRDAKTYVSNQDAAYEKLLSLIHDNNYFRPGYLPMYDDILAGAKLSFCEDDGDIVNLDDLLKQKSLFLQTVQNARPHPKK